jgi:hypothetical protein
MLGRMSLRLGLLVVLAGFLLGAACDGDDNVAGPGPACPNEQPAPGEACPQAGLTCNYFTGCDQFYPATCQDNLTWSVVDECVPFGGAGGVGGPSGGGGQAGAGGGGGGGGGGGQGGQGNGGEAGRGEAGLGGEAGFGSAGFGGF